MNSWICPHCGHDEFRQHGTITKYIHDDGSWDLPSESFDGDDAITCLECDTSFNEEQLDAFNQLCEEFLYEHYGLS